VGPQFVWAAVGIAGLLVAMRADYRWLRLLSLPAILVAGALLVLVLFSPWRIEVSGSTQWLKLPACRSSSPESSPSSRWWSISRTGWRGGDRDPLDPGGLLPFVVIVAPFLS